MSILPMRAAALGICRGPDQIESLEKPAPERSEAGFFLSSRRATGVSPVRRANHYRRCHGRLHKAQASPCLSRGTERREHATHRSATPGVCRRNYRSTDSPTASRPGRVRRKRWPARPPTASGLAGPWLGRSPTQAAIHRRATTRFPAPCRPRSRRPTRHRLR